MKKLSMLLLSMMSTFFLTAQSPGTPDLSFGNNGVSLVDFGGSQNYCYASDVMPNQKIVLGGETYNSTYDISFARLNTDGSPDVGFGTGGIITFVFGGSEDHIYDVLAQPDGNTLGIGYTCSGGVCSMLIVRLNVIGLMDLTFSNDGMLVVDFGPGYECFGMDLALQDDGKIIGCGHIRDLNGDLQCALCRINPDGSMDNTFGFNGVVIQNFLSYELNYTNNVAMQGDKIIVGGRSYNDGTFYLTLARFTSQGLIDASFGINGVVSIELNNDPWIISEDGAMCLDNQNRIVYGCYFESLSGSDFAVYRFLPDGTPDNSFGDFGLSVTDIDGNQNIYAITSQYDGKIIAGGSGGGDFVMVRYLENGDPDPSFGPSGSGIVISEAGTFISSLKLQQDGLIVAAGTEYDGFAGSSDFVATRFYSGLNVGISSPEASEINLGVYPNPFQDMAFISFNIAKPENLQAEIYNSYGARISIITNSFFPEGDHQLRWNADGLPVGMYIIKIRVGDRIYTSKLLKN